MSGTSVSVIVGIGREDACPYGVDVCGDQVASIADSTLAKMARISCSMASGIMADMVDDIEADILFKTSL